MKEFKKAIWGVFGYAYFPIYFIFWLLHKVARILLAIAYFGMLDGKKAKDIIRYMFIYNGRL